MYFIRKFYLLAAQGNSDAIPYKYAAVHLGYNVLSTESGNEEDLGELFEDMDIMDELADELGIFDDENEGLLYRLKDDKDEYEPFRVCICMDQLIPDYQFELIEAKYKNDIAKTCAADLVKELLEID